MNPRDLETAAQFVKLLRVLSDPQGVAKTIADIENATADYKKTKTIHDTIEAANQEAAKILAVAEQVRASTSVDKDAFAKVMATQLKGISDRETKCLEREDAVQKREDAVAAQEQVVSKRETAVMDYNQALDTKAAALAKERDKLEADKVAFADKLTKFNQLVGA